MSKHLAYRGYISWPQASQSEQGSRVGSLLPWGGLVVLAFSIGLGIAGCGAPREVVENDSATKIMRMRRAAEDQVKDSQTLCRLVANLESSDPAVRLYAIRALQKLTGESYGYLYYADDAPREAAVVRWKQWLAAQEKALQAGGEPSGVAEGKARRTTP